MTRWIFIFFTTCLLTLVQSQIRSPLAAVNGEAAPLTGGQPDKTQPALIIADEAELIIKGWQGGGSGYSGSVRLTNKSSGNIKILFLPSDLTRQKDGMMIDRQFITSDGEILLTPNDPQNIKIKVIGIEEPGTYKGQIEFRPKGATTGKILGLTVIVKSPQLLTPLSGTDQLKLHLTNGWFSCLLPTAETINQRVLQFKNPYQLPVKLTVFDFVINGEQTGYQLKSPMLRVESNGKEQNSEIVNLTLNLDRADIPPDKYTGSIFLRFEGAKEVLQLPVAELTMRYGPGRALLLLIMGILGGWFLRYMKTEGLALSKFTRYIDDLKARINRLDSFDGGLLFRMLEKVEFQVEDRQVKPEDALKELVKVENRWYLLWQVEEIEKSLTSPLPAISDKIKEIRVAIIQEKDEESSRLFSELESLILPTKQLPVHMSLARLPKPAKFVIPVPGGEKSPRERFKQFLIKFVVPPFYYTVVLLILMAAGLITLYLKNMTFGAAPLTDYIGLILWGFGADVASGNVENVLTNLARK